MCLTIQASYMLRKILQLLAVRTGVADISTIRRYELEVRQTPIQNDHDYADAPNFNHLSTCKVATVVYIAAYVFRMAKKSIQCNVSQDALVAEDPTASNFDFLAKHKYKWGLIKDSSCVFQSCESTESCLTRILNCQDHPTLFQPSNQWLLKKLFRKVCCYHYRITCLRALQKTTMYSISQNAFPNAS